MSIVNFAEILKSYAEGAERGAVIALRARWAEEIFDMLDSLLEHDHGYEVFEDLLRRKMAEYPD